jgi:hypothetical protein
MLRGRRGGGPAAGPRAVRTLGSGQAALEAPDTRRLTQPAEHTGASDATTRLGSHGEFRTQRRRIAPHSALQAEPRMRGRRFPKQSRRHLAPSASCFRGRPLAENPGSLRVIIRPV